MYKINSDGLFGISEQYLYRVWNYRVCSLGSDWRRGGGGDLETNAFDPLHSNMHTCE